MNKSTNTDIPKHPPWWVLLNLALNCLTATGGTITTVLTLLEVGI